MNKSRIAHIFLAAMLIMAFFLPVSVTAQDPAATVESAPFAIVTQEAAPPITCQEGATCIVNEATPETSAPADNSPLALLLLVGGAFVTVVVSISLGLQVVGNRANAAANNPLEIAVIEKAYESIPPTVLATIVDPLKAALERSDKALQSVIDLLNKAGDRVPEASKPAPSTPYPPATGTPLDRDYTLPKTDTLPNRPADGGAPGVAGTGFPPVR